MKATMFACNKTLTQFPSSPTKHADPSANHFHASYTSFLFTINLLKPTGHVMHQQFNIQQL